MQVLDKDMAREISERLILHWNYRGFTTLPTELQEYGQHVKELYLKYNLLSALPNWLICLTNLTNIYLQANSLIKLPESVCCLVNLEVLDISQNALQTLPESIGKLTKLTRLVLTGNKLSDLPEGLGQLHNLVSLQLSSNCLRWVPQAVKHCSALNDLCIDKNLLKTLPLFVTRLPKLQYVSACGNDLCYLPNVPFAKVKRFLFDNNPGVTHTPYPIACQISRDSSKPGIPAGSLNFPAYGCFKGRCSTSFTQLCVNDFGQRLFLSFPPFEICNDTPNLREIALRSLVSSVFGKNITWSCDDSKRLHRVTVDRTWCSRYESWINKLEELIIPSNLLKVLREGPLGFCARPTCSAAFFTAAYPVVVPKHIVRRQDNSGATLERICSTLLYCSAACLREHLSSCTSAWEREMLLSSLPFHLMGSEYPIMDSTTN